jgi:hypothetical protein
MNQIQLIKEEKLATIIELCNAIEIDGETLQYVTEAIGMEEQMLRQLIMTMPMTLVQELVEEKALNEFDVDKDDDEWDFLPEDTVYYPS